MNCSNMGTIDCIEKGLTDSELVKIIEELAEDVECKELILNDNKLQNVPDFTKCKQFTGLYFGDKDGYNSRNYFTFVQPELLPPSLTCLDLSWNNLTEMPDFSQCVKLQELYLCHNNLSVVQLEHLPPNLTHLDLITNKLTEVPNFSQYVNLQKLDLEKNNLSVV